MARVWDWFLAHKRGVGAAFAAASAVAAYLSHPELAKALGSVASSLYLAGAAPSDKAVKTFGEAAK